MSPSTSLFRQGWLLAREVIPRGGRRFWLVAGLGLVAALVESGGLLLLPWLLRILGLDGGLAEGHPLGAVGRSIGVNGALLAYLTLALGGAAVVYAHAVAVQALILAHADHLRQRLYRAVLAVEWGAPVLRRPVEFVHDLTVCCSQSGMAVRHLLNLLTGVIQIPALLGTALVLSTPFAILSLGLSVLLIIMRLPLAKRSHALALPLVQASRDLHSLYADHLAGLRAIKLLSLEAVCDAEAEHHLAGLRALQLEQARLGGTSAQAQKLAIAVLSVLGLWVGLTWLRVPMAEMLALVLLFSRVLMIHARFQEQMSQLLRLLPIHADLTERIELCRAAAGPSLSEGVPSPRLIRQLRLDGVHYAPPGQAEIIAGIDAVIPAGSITALSGPSGAGKSTLADLLMGLTAPTAGRILVDDMSLTGDARLAWRSRISYVPQDCFLFDTTIGANLRLAAPAAQEAELWQALEQAGAADIVRSFPDGLDTQVGDRGTRLSGGERQRVLFARALLKQSDLLLLDEATSALDEETEAALLQTLMRLRGRITIVIISHRPRVEAIADQVIRLGAA